MNRLKKFWRALGPGFITGAADDDPSGVVTYSQSGAQFGYSQLWVMLFTLPFMIVVQETAARIGLVNGKGLSGVMKKHYPRTLLYGAVLLLFLANIVNIGADLGAMAASAQLIIPVPFVLILVLLTLLTIFLEVFIQYPTYARYLKYLTITLFAYIFTAFFVHLDWHTILVSTFVPHITTNKAYALTLLAVLGTTISPYLFFWQADEEVEEEVEQHKLKALGVGRPRVTPRALKQLRADTILGMLFSNVTAFFIIIAAAATLGSHGIRNIDTAAQAAEALVPIAGKFASILFVVGIIGTGLLAVPVLAGSASYAIAEALGWKEGLSLRWKQARSFYLLIAFATGVGLLINLLHVSPLHMLIYSAALNALLTPPLLIAMLLIANNKKIMGPHTNTRAANAWTIVLTILLIIVSVAFFVL